MIAYVHDKYIYILLFIHLCNSATLYHNNIFTLICTSPLVSWLNACSGSYGNPLARQTATLYIIVYLRVIMIHILDRKRYNCVQNQF